MSDRGLAPAWRLVTMLLAVVVMGGCTHAMRIKNLDQYKKEVAASPSPLAIGLKDGAVPGDGEQLFEFVNEAMHTNPNVRQVVLPGQDGWDQVDAVVTVSPRAVYDGSGWNFLITFPGFLVFAHAWNGYVYSADVVTDVAVEMPAQTAVNTQIETKYSLRHCCFGRGAAASSGWYVPGYGGTDIFVGLYMIGYDDDATPEFLQAVRTAYGEYIANSVVELVEHARQRAVGTVSTSHHELDYAGEDVCNACGEWD